MIPFWTTCYDVNSDMGVHLMGSASPSFQAELSDPNFVWRQFGKYPKDAAGRQRLATDGPSLRQQLQASLNALHPLLGKDEVAQTMFTEGTKMLSTLRQTLPDTKDLEAAIKSNTGDVLRAYGPKLSDEAVGLIFNEKNRQQLLGAVATMTAPSRSSTAASSRRSTARWPRARWPAPRSSSRGSGTAGSRSSWASR